MDLCCEYANHMFHCLLKMYSFPKGYVSNMRTPYGSDLITVWCKYSPEGSALMELIKKVLTCELNFLETSLQQILDPMWLFFDVVVIHHTL